jgi:hypothetical protein
MKTYIHFRSYLAHFFLEWKILQTNLGEKLETHILYSVTFFRKSCRLGDNIEKFCRGGRPQIWRMRIACWIPKATNAHTGCVILIAFPLQQWLHERASMLRYKYIACPVVTNLSNFSKNRTFPCITLISSPYSWIISDVSMFMKVKCSKIKYRVVWKSAQRCCLSYFLLMSNIEKFHMTEDYNEIYILHYLSNFLHASVLLKSNLV